MLHPRLTSSSGHVAWLADLGDYGAWGDLSFTTRWGSGACGMYEASWTMPLPPDFEHPVLRRGTKVELMDGPWRIGSSLVLTGPERGSGFDDPWQFTATGIGREVEGDASWYAFDLAGETTSVPSTAVDAAMFRGLPWAGRDPSVPTAQVGASTETDAPNTVGSLLSASADSLGQRWGVDRNNMVRFMPDPTTPTLHAVPGTVSLGVTDDDYASVVFARYLSADVGALKTTGAENAAASDRYGRREYLADVTTLGAIPATGAQAFADGILAKSKGRLGWTNGLTLTSQELLTDGGVPVDLSMVQAGQMVRLHGVYNDLLEYTGQQWLDIIIGETKYTDGEPTIDISPLGLAPRDLASVVEAITGIAAS